MFVEGPRWRTLGYENVSKDWTDFIDSAITVKHCEWVDDLKARVTDGMGIVAGISELTVDINGVEKKIRFRGTSVFEKGNGRRLASTTRTLLATGRESLWDRRLA